MAVHKRRRAPDGPMAPEEIAGLDYAGLVAAWCAMDDDADAHLEPRVSMPGPPPGARAMVARLEELAAADPSVVGAVRLAAPLRHAGTRQPGDWARSETSMAVAAVRAAHVLADAGGIVRRGPFRALSVTSSRNNNKEISDVR